jgi:hypothetical protein
MCDNNGIQIPKDNDYTVELQLLVIAKQLLATVKKVFKLQQTESADESCATLYGRHKKNNAGQN